MNRAQKSFERKQLDKFLEVLGFGEQVAHIAANERPDFLLTCKDGQRIALEHTQPRDKSRAAHDRLLPSLTQALRTGMEERGESLWIHLTIPLVSAQELLSKPGSADAIATALLSLIASDRERVQSSWAEYPGRVLQEHPLLRALEEVHVVEADAAIATWGSQNLSKRLVILQEAIVSKVNKLADYQRNVSADEFWLLVVSGPGLGCIPSILQSQLPRVDGYDRIYLMDEFGQHCHALHGELNRPQ